MYVGRRGTAIGAALPSEGAHARGRQHNATAAEAAAAGARDSTLNGSQRSRENLSARP